MIGAGEKDRFRGRRGSALFLILIGLALFAALAYSVTQASRSGSGTTSREQVSLAVTQLYDYVSAIQSAVSRLTAAGCSNTQLNFYSTRFSVPAQYDGITAGHAPADHSCDVFDPAGAGVAWQEPPALTKVLLGKPFVMSAFEYAFTPMMIVAGIGTSINNTASAAELSMIAMVTPEMCIEINKRAGFPVVTTTPIPQHNFAQFGIPLNYFPGTTNFAFFGDYASTQGSGFWMFGWSAGQALDLANQWTGCFVQLPAFGQGLTYVFYQVLVAR